MRIISYHEKRPRKLSKVNHLNPLTPIVKHIQGFLTFDSMDGSVTTIHWKAVEQYFTVVLFVFQFYPVCNFGTFIKFGLGTVGSERVKLRLDIPLGC